jgi:transcriptional regulator with XRE-family HTH domain
MDDSIESKVGQRIRKHRVQKSLSLRKLSEQSGLSINAISLIERGENSATLSSLHRLSEALGTPIASLFQDENEQTTLFVRHNQGRHFRNNGIVVVNLGSRMSNQHMEAFSISIDPGAGTMKDPITHQGEEFVRCLEGKVEFFVGEQTFSMTQGDSLFFDPAQPHSFRNTTQSPATILKIIHAGDDQAEARQKHLDSINGQ